MKLLILSDTHGFHGKVPDLPEADVFIHAGDFMNSGRDLRELLSFNAWLGNISVPRDLRFVTSGNHDIMFDETHKDSNREISANARRHLTNCVYLQDQEVVINGVKIYMSPWTPRFFDWGFNADRGQQIKKYWDKIPADTDVLVTHGPPMGILDRSIPVGGEGDSPFNHKLGCEELYEAVKRIKPKYHIFGHIHGSRGMVNVDNKTTFINASFLNERYKPHAGHGYFLVEI